MWTGLCMFTDTYNSRYFERRRHVRGLTNALLARGTAEEGGHGGWSWINVCRAADALLGLNELCTGITYRVVRVDGKDTA